MHDIYENEGGSLLDPSTYRPRSSLRTYVENGVEGAAIGAFCGPVALDPYVCAGGATFVRSLAHQEVDQYIDKGSLNPLTLNYCEANVNASFADAQ